MRVVVIISGVKGNVMECVFIKDKTYDPAVERFCYPQGKWLGAVDVSPNRDTKRFKIYKLKQGKPFINTPFSTLEDCIGAIKVFNEVYGEYFPIWENKDWIDADIPALLKWTVRNGVNIHEFLEKAEEDGCVIRCASLSEVAL